MGFRARKRIVARVIPTATLALVLATGGAGLMAGTAQAQSVSSGSLSFSGDDWISGGQSYTYSTDTQDVLTVSADSNDRTVDISALGAQDPSWEGWDLVLQAPAGQTLQPGEYANATRFPFNGNGTGLSLTGQSRGCNTVTGSFAVSDAVFGPYGYVQTLDASFEEHCEGGTAATRGEVHIHNPVAPAQLNLGLAVAEVGTASALDGNAIVHGTVTCDEAAQVDVSGTATQVRKHIILRAPFSTSVACKPGAAVPWTAQAVPPGSTPFRVGDMEAATQASATDPNYPRTATASQTVAVKLKNG